MELSNFAAVQTTGEKSSLLGYLTWYTVSDVEKTRDELDNNLTRHGFRDHLPRAISPSDAFRRATSEVQRKNVETLDPNVFFNYLVREVSSDRNEIVRHIVIEVRDKKDKKLHYDPDTAIIRYDKKSDRIEYQATSLEAETLVLDAKIFFNKYRYTYNARHIREMVCEILCTMSPVPVRPSGGVYFVPNRHHSKLKDFVELVNQLGASEAFMVLLINTEANKDMIRRKVADHIMDTIRNMADFLKNDVIDKTNGNIKLGEIKRVIADFRAYQDELKLSMGDMEENLDLLRQQAEKILDKLS